MCHTKPHESMPKRTFQPGPNLPMFRLPSVSLMLPPHMPGRSGDAFDQLLCVAADEVS